MNAIFQMFEQQSRAWHATKEACPPLSSLFHAAAAGGDPEVLRKLARHLTACTHCAMCWQTLVDDPCLSLGEAYALFIPQLEATPDLRFARLRAESHIARCGQCQQVRALVARIRHLLSPSPSIWYSTLGQSLRQQRLAPVCREASAAAASLLDAWLLTPDGHPRIVAGRAQALKVPVERAILRSSGLLEIALAVPSGTEAVLCAINQNGQILMLPEIRPSGRLAELAIDTQTQDMENHVDQRLPPGLLTIWLLMSDSAMVYVKTETINETRHEAADEQQP